MSLQKGQLFHNRYLLVSALGQGASAEVWKANDTRANNLTVALKIFSQHSEMDSYGLQNFQREFTTVYNMKQSNLLPPTGYDICDGRPYLIMQYCENGSCSGMVGRMEESDIIKLLHDVSAGLEYLHDHNIIHQDIKPDNILLDDNCNYLVTDFGISVNSDNGIFNSNGMSGGTRAYMGPERFEGVTNNASDMWSLGATAVELLTGNPPYGEHGGLLQAEGEKLPDLPKLQPEVSEMIMGCLAKDPSKRLKANEIRQKIELYWETGSWEVRSSKKLIAMIATVVACVLMCIGIFVWDYNRTKVYYYKDYVEYNAVPHGIYRLSSKEVAHRSSSYKFEYSQHKLRRMSLVNSAGKIVSHRDTEHMVSRYSDIGYFYTDDGKIDYATIYDTNGRLLFKLDYDDNLKTATLRQNDEYGTELNLKANTNQLIKTSGLFDEKSRISRYLLTYDDQGRIIERRYAGLQNVPACDKDNVYGIRYKYDDRGHVIEESYVGADGAITSNQDGLAIKVFGYDEQDDWISIQYLNSERSGSHDGNNCSLVKIACDEYGNRIEETYYTLEGEPSIRTDMHVHGFRYEYDDRGNRIVQTCIGTNGDVAYCTYGFVSVHSLYNEDGFNIQDDYYDENGEHIPYSESGSSYCSVKLTLNDFGQWTELCFYDEAGQPIEQGAGYSRATSVYDSLGNTLEVRFFDKDNNPVLSDGFYHIKRSEYDEFCNLTKESYYDENDEPTTCDGCVSAYKLEYNRQGAITKCTFLDKEGKLVLAGNQVAGYTREYDELGNLKSTVYFDDSMKPTMSTDGYSKLEYVYDSKTNFVIEERYYNNNGKLIKATYYKHDDRGNQIENYTLVDNKLEPGSAVVHSEYDANNRLVAQWTTDLSGKKVNQPKVAYSMVKNEYDNKGNCVQTTYWKVDGTPAVDVQSAHKRVREYDEMNRIVAELNYGTDGKPISGKDANPEGHVKYDQWGNMSEISCYDGYGAPRLSADGYFMVKMEYDLRGNLLSQAYFGIDGKPVCSKNNEYAKVEHSYDKHGNKVESKFYDVSKCTRIETWSFNSKNQLTEQRVCDANGKLSDKYYGISWLTIEYDSTGVTPKVQKFYNQDKKLIASQTWNVKTQDWNSLSMSGNYSSAPSNMSSGRSWQASVRSDAQQCPIKLSDGVYFQSITYSNTSVTVTIKISTISKYDLGDVDEQQWRELGQSVKPSLRDAWALPSGVSLYVVITDKADRKVCTL
jgi:serine/threonine protein kinase